MSQSRAESLPFLNQENIRHGWEKADAAIQGGLAGPGKNAQINKHSSLPGAILATADVYFHVHGFEQTDLLDICKSLEINHSEFYRHFESLDEVLEILWAR